MWKLEINGLKLILIKGVIMRNVLKIEEPILRSHKLETIISEDFLDFIVLNIWIDDKHTNEILIIERDD